MNSHPPLSRVPCPPRMHGGVVADVEAHAERCCVCGGLCYILRLDVVTAMTDGTPLSDLHRQRACHTPRLHLR